MRPLRLFPASLVLVGAVLPVPKAVAIPPPGASRCSIFPSNNVWHSDISKLPVHPRSVAWKRSMDASLRRLHPDFGPSDEPMPYGIPYTVVPGSYTKVAVDFTYADESDPGPYPFGSDTPIEGGSDRHAIMIDGNACRLYELYAAEYAPGGGSTAGSGAIWDLRSNALRPAGWTSADAAGLPIFAGLLRLDEVRAGVVDHAIRVTASRTDRTYVWPARHQAGAASNRNLPPMGARFRLRSSFSLSGFRSDTRVILKAMQRYGLILADNGSDWFFTGTAEDGWPTALLDELKSVPASAFDAVDASSLMIDRNSGRIRAPATSRPRTISTPKPKPSTAPSTTPTPTPTPTPSAEATPSPTRSSAPVVAARSDDPTSSRSMWLLFGAGVAAGFGAWLIRRRVRGTTRLR